MTISTHKISFAFVSLVFVFIACLAVAGITEHYEILAIPFAALLFYAGWSHINFIFLLLLLSLAFSFEFNFSPSLGTDIPDEGLMLLTAVIFLCYWVFNPPAINKKTLQHPLLLLLLIHLTWIVLTTVTSSDRLLSFKFLLAKSWYAGAFVLAPLIAFRDKKIFRLSAIIIAFSLCSIAITALTRHAADNFSFAGVNQAVFPFFRNHVNYSSMLVCAIPLFVAFYQLSAKRTTRFWIIIALAVLLAALFFSYARGAWLALFFGATSYWLFIKKKLFFVFLTAIAVSAMALFWLKSNDRYLRYAHDYQTTIFHENFEQHLVATYQLKDVSTAERFYRWIAGVRMIKDNWATGFGPGTFYENYKPYGVPAFKTWVSDNKERSTVHNYFLLLAIEQGWPGLLFFLLLLGVMFYYAQQLYHRVTDPFYKTAAITVGVILVMLTTVNFLSDLVETDKIGSLFFLCFSALVMIDINTRKELKTSPHI